MKLADEELSVAEMYRKHIESRTKYFKVLFPTAGALWVGIVIVGCLSKPWAKEKNIPERKPGEEENKLAEEYKEL